MTTRMAGWWATPLVSAFAVLRVAAAGPGQYTVGDLAITLVAVVITAAIVAAAVHSGAVRVGASPRTVRAVDIVVVAATALFFWGVPIALALGSMLGVSIAARLAVALTLLGIIAAVVVAWRRDASFDLAARFAVTMSLLLVVGAALQLAVEQAGFNRLLARHPVVAHALAPIPVKDSTGLKTSVPRDIYLLVLDARANAKTLDRFFGHDDRAFTDSLRALGFVIPAGFHSNYVHTGVSLPSLLNLTHVDELRDSVGERAGAAVVRELVERNRSAAFLKAKGYRYVLFPSEWYGLTARSPLADYTFRAVPAWHKRQIFGTEFRRVLFAGTPVMRLPWMGDPTAHVRASFAGLKDVADDPRPTFTFAHFLLPHPPYVFSDDCQADVRDPAGDTALEGRLYVRQVRCTNDLVLDAVNGILARSTPRPIIAIVGDHGSRITPFAREMVDTGMTPALEERFGAFGAFLTPDAPDLFAGDLTLVNVMQRILGAYFGTDVPAAPDRFFAAESDALDFWEVPAEVATGTPP